MDLPITATGRTIEVWHETIQYLCSQCLKYETDVAIMIFNILMSYIHVVPTKCMGYIEFLIGNCKVIRNIFNIYIMIFDRSVSIHSKYQYRIQILCASY